MLMLDPPDPDTPARRSRAWSNWRAAGAPTSATRSSSTSSRANNMAIPVVVNYPRHAVTEQFNGVMTAYPLARSVMPVEGGTDGKTAQKLLETSPRSWAETDLKALFETKKPEPNLDKGDKAGPVTIATATSAPAAERLPRRPRRRRPPPPRRRAEAGDARHRGRRQRLPVELGHRVPGQQGSVPEHGQLAGAAGEPDRDPREGSLRPPDRHDARAGSRPALADARRSFPRCSSATASGCGGRDGRGVRP